MSQNLRQIKLRIRSIESTKRIMRAMEMVSAAKLNRVKAPFYSTKAYSTALETMLKDLVADSGDMGHPLLVQRHTKGALALCIVASDTGLCGSYNHNVLKKAEAFLDGRDDASVRLVAVGREAYKHFKGRGSFTNTYLGLYGRYSTGMADEITRDLLGMYERNEVDEVYIAYTHFSPSLRHLPVVEKLLNVECSGIVCPIAHTRGYIVEPGARELLENMLPAYITSKIRSVLLEAFTAEHSERMLAMKTANDNATELIDSLTLLRNKARQFAITKEILEIAASAEALKG